MTKKSNKQLQTEAGIRKLIAQIYDPRFGLPIEDISKQLLPAWRFMDGPMFRRESKYIERIIGSMRAEAMAEWREEKRRILEESETPLSDIALNIPVPDFLPFALKKDQIHWCYFNCVRKPWTDNVEKICRQKAEGLIRTADQLDEMFG